MRRQKKQNEDYEEKEDLDRDDLALAQWFCGCQLEPGEDEIFDQITSSKESENIRLIQWTDSEELQELYLKYHSRRIT